ncbi:MAG TPA: flavodoxin-dependent (E)-4-hydroxy-3-methylbut-2-enyl-diphosphate synthase [Victivallales bacterium]|nr:flavodoxin-dependent (E)-4-hydroxy-3-methylbut-2-enyl-diphosphate synthase [Victivallales bacterium]
MLTNRRKTRQISVGNVQIGSEYPISIQSMTNTDTKDINSTLQQINALAENGCEIIRIAIPDIDSADSVKDIVKESPIPVIGDIHFDHRLALTAIKHGIHGIRINPGNIGSLEKVKQIANMAKLKNIPIRVGANTGSLARKFQVKNYDLSEDEKRNDLADSLVKSALKQCELLEKFDFRDIKVSLKASDVLTSIKAYESFAKLTDYPLHLGITEAGTFINSAIKSSIGIGSLLLAGLGDTIRVSVTGSPLEELKIAKMILESTGCRDKSIDIISCPTCGRTTTDLVNLVNKVETLINNLKKENKHFKRFKIAIMGCAVNGPGEAKDADFGIAGAKGNYILFKNGKTLSGNYNELEALNILTSEIKKHAI